MLDPYKSAVQSREAVKCQLAAAVLQSHGGVRLRVTGTSMLPSVRPGDLLCIGHQDAAEAQAGDIVLFGREGRLSAHRVVRKVGSRGECYWITGGDSLAQGG